MQQALNTNIQGFYELRLIAFWVVSRKRFDVFGKLFYGKFYRGIFAIYQLFLRQTQHLRNYLELINDFLDIYIEKVVMPITFVIFTIWLSSSYFDLLCAICDFFKWFPKRFVFTLRIIDKIHEVLMHLEELICKPFSSLRFLMIAIFKGTFQPTLISSNANFDLGFEFVWRFKPSSQSSKGFEQNWALHAWSRFRERSPLLPIPKPSRHPESSLFLSPPFHLENPHLLASLVFLFFLILKSVTIFAIRI